MEAAANMRETNRDTPPIRYMYRNIYIHIFILTNIADLIHYLALLCRVAGGSDI